MKKFSFLLIVPIVLTSCFNNKKIWDYEAEYKGRDKNIYMTGVKTAPADNYYLDPIMRISRIEPVGDSVRLYTHLIDGDGMFLSGTATPAHINNWCSVVVNDQPIREYTVREVSDYDRSPTVYALVLDHSGSMGVRTKKMQDAVRAFINKKRPQDAICIVKYDTKANLEVPINTSVTTLQALFGSNGLVGYGGGTAILNGMLKGAEAIAASPYRRKVVISFTDGGDNSSTVTKEYVTWFAQQNKINLCTIDFNNSNYNNFMQDLANQTSGTYTYFTNANQFDMVFSDVVNKMNHSYVVTYKAQPNVSQQTVALRYCAEPQALEATSGYNTSRPVAQPVRDAPRPVNNNNNSSASASGDRPVFYRPNTPIQAPANNTGTNTVRPTPPRTIPTNGNNSGIRQPNGTTSPINNQIESGPTKPAPSNGNNDGIRKPGGSANPVNNQIESSPTKPAPSNGNNVSPTKPSPANGNSGVGNGTSKPDASNGNSSSEGSPIKPPPSNGGNNSGGNTSSPTKPSPSNGNTVSPTKPSPANGNSGVGSGTSKPDSSNGSSSSSEGSPIKPPPSNGGSNNGGTTKPVTKPSSTKPTTKPSGIKGSTKTPTVKPGTTGNSTGSGRDSNSNTAPTKPGYTRTPRDN